MKVFPTNLNGHLSPTVSRPSEGRAGRDTVGTGDIYLYIAYTLYDFKGADRKANIP